MPTKQKLPMAVEGVRRKKKKKEPTQRTPMQRVKVLGSNGKIRWEWREWPKETDAPKGREWQ